MIKVVDVDGEAIRKQYPNFTNWSHHWLINDIPKDEIWIDQEAHPKDDRPFFIVSAMRERMLMERGVPFLQAHERTIRLEKASRQRVAQKEGEPLDEDPRIKILLGGRDTIWLVDGSKIRKQYPDFTEGGHDLVYPWIQKFGGRHQVWIDDDLEEDERIPTIVHELTERQLMSVGCKYHKAHKEALMYEETARGEENK